MTLASTVLNNVASANSLKLVTWAGLVNGQDGSPIQFSDWADRCIHVYGTFGAGGTVVFQGSNEAVNPTNWVQLNDINGNALSFTAAAMKQMNEAPLWIRPLVTGGDGTTSLTAAVIARRLVQTSQ